MNLLISPRHSHRIVLRHFASGELYTQAMQSSFVTTADGYKITKIWNHYNFLRIKIIKEEM